MPRDRAAHAKYMREWTAKHRAAGLCVECNDKALPGIVRCAKHNRKRLRRDKRSAHGGGRFAQAKWSAKQRGEVFTLSREEYFGLLAKPCAYCALPNDVQRGVGLDRIDNSKGYEPGNVVSCCRLCNVTRVDSFTPSEMKILGKAIRKIRLAREAAVI